MSEEVLAASKRGHTSSVTERACELVKKYGFELVGQMMIGLPDANSEKECYTAHRICEMGADKARVYPTVVFYDTELCDMSKRGEYQPLTDEEAVARTKEVLKVFDSFGVPCIRVGLCASENLSDESSVYGGANHSAIGELAMGEVYYDKICELLDNNPCLRGDTLVIYGALGASSKISGQNRRNKIRICKKYGFNKIKILEKNEIIGYNIILDTFIR
jgi:histone acetyltransferase (RNA polymerase elongator complex component)